MSTRNCPDAAIDDDDDDIGALVYQHAKMEAEKAAASRASSEKTVVPYRRSARNKSTMAPLQQSDSVMRVADPTKAKASKLRYSKAKTSWRTRHHDVWTTRYNELLQYKRDFGNCNVPKIYKANPQLGTWVGNQRKFFKKKSLADVRIAKLNRIGFVWKIDREDAWVARFKELVQYKHEFGDCNVPPKYKSNQQLANWVRHLRDNFKIKSIPEHRIEKLTRIGFF